MAITDSEFDGTIYARKTSNIVMLRFDGFKVSGSKTTASAIIPSEFRPNNHIRAVLSNGAATKMCLMYVMSDGNLNITVEDAGTSYYGSMLFLKS